MRPGHRWRYRGPTPALTDLIGGQVQVMFDTLSSSIEHIRAGRPHALGGTSATRLSSFRPDSGSWSCPLRLFRRGLDLAKMPVHKLLYVRHAVEFQQLHVLFDPPVQ